MKPYLLVLIAACLPVVAQTPGAIPGGGSGGGGTASYCAPASASGTTYTCAPSPAVAAYSAGLLLTFVPDVNSTGGATTLNVSSLGAKSVKEADGTTNPTSTDFVAGESYYLSYDGTVFRISPAATSGIVTEQRFQVAAKCQAGAAGIAFSYAVLNAPSPFCVIGSNTIFGTAQFTAFSQSVQDHFTIPTAQTGNVDFSLKTRAVAITGNQIWDIQTACVAPGATGNPSFNAAQTVTIATAGTTLQFTGGARSAITFTGCAPGYEFYWLLTLDPTTTTTVNGSGSWIDLLSIGWTVRHT